MAIKGLAVPVFGEYNYDGNKSYYTNGFIAGKAVEYGAEVETSDDNPLYADNGIAEHDYGKFSAGTLTLNTTDLDYYTSKRLLNLKEVTTIIGGVNVKELVRDDDAVSTAKGFGVIEWHQIDDVDKYRAVILCKVMPKNPAEAATTKAEAIEWQTKELECSFERTEEVNENYNHPWMREAWFDNEADALEYLKTALNAMERLAVTSQEGTTAGKTKLSVSPVLTSGNSYKYSSTGPAPTYKQDLTSWEDWDGTEEITAANGTTLYIAEIDKEKKAVKYGTVTVVSKSE